MRIRLGLFNFLFTSKHPEAKSSIVSANICGSDVTQQFHFISRKVTTVPVFCIIFRFKLDLKHFLN